MFMFRRKRTGLAKRLWKARRIRAEDGGMGAKNAIYLDEFEKNCGSGCCSLSDEGILRNSVLKRLKDNQLEMLVEAVESGGYGVSTCVLVPREVMDNAHVLCCQMWRWPDLCSSSELRRTPACPSVNDPVYVCCNPYHWSRLCDSELPPPPYSRFASKSLEEDRTPNQRDCKSDHKCMPYISDAHSPIPGSFSTSGLTPNAGAGQEWCKLAYWEMKQRVGRLYSVQQTSVNVFWNELQADGLSLETIAQPVPPNHESVTRNRQKIGLGITLSVEEDGIWAYNRSDWPIFVNSPWMGSEDCSRSGSSSLVHRVPAGHCLKIFSAGPFTRECTQHYKQQYGIVDPHCVRISFAKGWGPKYTRQEITSCPNWIEVLLSPCR